MRSTIFDKLQEQGNQRNYLWFETVWNQPNMFSRLNLHFIKNRVEFYGKKLRVITLSSRG